MAHSIYYSFSPFLNSTLTEQEDPVSTGDAVTRKTFPMESPKSTCTTTTDQSLAAALSTRHGSLKEFTAKLVREAKHRRLAALPLSVTKSNENEEQGYSCEPPSKRRRFERRNSKTAAMLISSLSSINPADFRDDETSEELSEDPWDGGLEIAEDLVRQLKLRRMSRTCPST